MIYKTCLWLNAFVEMVVGGELLDDDDEETLFGVDQYLISLIITFISTCFAITQQSESNTIVL